MRFVSCVNAGLVLALAACAAPAPNLPRHVSRVDEAGFAQTGAYAAPGPNVIVITQSTWAAMSREAQTEVLAVRQPKIIADGSYGIIVDVQSDDQSTSGTVAGAALGSAAVQAAYVDRAIGGGNYSASNHLALGLLGAAIGSSLDSPATQKHQNRYTVRLGDGEIQYFDEVKGNRFRHSTGVCVSVPELELLSQRICNQTPEAILAAVRAASLDMGK